MIPLNHRKVNGIGAV